MAENDRPQAMPSEARPIPREGLLADPAESFEAAQGVLDRRDETQPHADRGLLDRRQWRDRTAEEGLLESPGTSHEADESLLAEPTTPPADQGLLQHRSRGS